MTDFQRQLAAQAQAAGLQYLIPALPYLIEDLEKAQRMIVIKVMTAMGKGEFKPDAAQLAWVEYITLERQKGSYRAKIAQTQAAAQATQPAVLDGSGKNA